MQTTNARTQFKVTLIYDNVSAGRRAYQLYLELERKFSGEYEFESHLSNTAILADPAIADIVAEQLDDADVILVALESESAPNPNFKRLMEELSLDDRELKPLLLALADEDRPGADFLRNLADRKGMEFISNSEAADRFSGKTFTRNRAAKLIMPELERTELLENCAHWGWAQFSIRNAAWGINE